MTNTWDAANRLVAATRGAYALEPIYNGAGDRVAETAGLTTTYFALDVQGLPEVIYTSGGEAYLHLPGVIVAESASGERRYLLSDGLGSARQATDESGQVVAYHEFDPYGVPMQDGGDPYGFTGEWWEDQVDLLHLRARWYDPDIARFLTQDAWQGDYLQPLSMNPYLYSLANPANFFDPSGHFATNECDPPFDGYLEGISLSYGGSLVYLEQVALGQRQLDEIFFIYTLAAEWVYDFAHKEWSIFAAWSQTAETSLGVSMSTTHYQGTIDGFSNYRREIGVDGYEGPFWVQGFNVGVSFYLYGFGFSKTRANPMSQEATNLEQMLTATVYKNKMTVDYYGFYASLGKSIDLGSVAWVLARNKPLWDLVNLADTSMSPAFVLSGGSSSSERVGPLYRESTAEQLARIIEEGYNPVEPNLLGRRITYFNPLFIPRRHQAVKVLRTYFQ
jgi:RHS repeat-associated protein